jgi:ADP-ribosylglycohydrolase
VSAIPTHNTSVGFAGAAAVAGAVAVALGGASLDAVIRAGIEGAERGHDRGRPWLAASLSRRIKLAVNIAQGGGTPRAKLREMYAIVGTSLAITESVAAAFGVVALANGDPVWAAKYAAALSGDADTIGAIACAICGAYAAIIPADIEATLRAANPEYDFEALTDGLFRVASR